MVRKPYITVRHWLDVKGVNVFIDVPDESKIRADSPMLFKFFIEEYGKYKKGTEYGFRVDRKTAIMLAVRTLCLASYEICVDEADKESGLDAECKTAFKDCLNNPQAFIEHIKTVLEVVSHY